MAEMIKYVYFSLNKITGQPHENNCNFCLFAPKVKYPASRRGSSIIRAVSRGSPLRGLPLLQKPSTGRFLQFIPLPGWSIKCFALCGERVRGDFCGKAPPDIPRKRCLSFSEFHGFRLQLQTQCFHPYKNADENVIQYHRSGVASAGIKWQK